MPPSITDAAVLRETLLRVLAEGPATWPELQERAGGNLDIIAAGLALSRLEQEGMVQRSRPPGEAWSTYQLVALH